MRPAESLTNLPSSCHNESHRRITSSPLLSQRRTLKRASCTNVGTCMQKTRQSQIADFAPGACAVLCRCVYDDDTEQCGATWRICWKFMTSCSSTTFTWTLPMSHSMGRPLWENMTSSTKPEVHNVFRCRQSSEDDQNHGTV